MKKDNILISIIVPCYNQAQYLSETLDSVLVQTYQNWECIICNDGSIDNSEEIAKSYCAVDQRYIYIRIILEFLKLVIMLSRRVGESIFCLWMLMTR